VLYVEDLYVRDGRYEYSRGFNWCAVTALALGAGTALSGLLAGFILFGVFVMLPSLKFLYDYSWFVGFAVSFVAYFAMMKFQRPPVITP